MFFTLSGDPLVTELKYEKDGMRHWWAKDESDHSSFEYTFDVLGETSKSEEFKLFSKKNLALALL